MTDTYRVTAPYVTLKSKAEAGGDVVLGYYTGALVPETVDPGDLARHIRKGMVEKLEGAEASAVQKAQADAAKAVEDQPEDKDGATAVKKAAAVRATAKADADREEAEAAKEGKPLLRAADSKPGAKTATAG